MEEAKQLMIPDALLEMLTCDVCGKFLSVTPIKMYLDGIIKCGRCSDKNDDGKYSMYNKLITESFFPCINVYEGCRKALRHFEVVDHEKYCRKTTIYNCPVCFWENMNVRDMWIHFKTNHDEKILLNPRFKLKEYTFYMYKNELNVFQICVSQNKNNIKVVVRALGPKIHVRHISVSFSSNLEFSTIDTVYPGFFEINIPVNKKLFSDNNAINFEVQYDGILSNKFNFWPSWSPDSEASYTNMPLANMINLICTNCKKYLSVAPVKLYPGGIIKCGRCSRTDDEGTPSLYNQIAQKIDFPCMNSLTELIEECGMFNFNSGILKHEKNCYMRKFKCFICTHLLNLSPNEMLIHFTHSHSNHILKEPKFILEHFTSYLYFDENNISIIEISPFNTEEIKIMITVLGNRYVLSSVTFDVESEYSTIDTKNFQSYAIRVPCRPDNKPVVTFKIIYDFMGQQLYFPISIQLTKGFRKNYPYCTDYDHQIDMLRFLCQRCDTYDININYSVGNNNYICTSCAFFKNLGQEDKIVIHQKRIDIYNALSIKCPLGCEGIFNLVSYIELKHEYYCPCRPEGNCPVEHCQWSGNLSLLETHFKTNHLKFIFTDDTIFTYEEVSEICDNNNQVFIRDVGTFAHLIFEKMPNGTICCSKDSIDLYPQIVGKTLWIMVVAKYKEYDIGQEKAYLSTNQYLTLVQIH